MLHEIETTGKTLRERALAAYVEQETARAAVSADYCAENLAVSTEALKHALLEVLGVETTADDFHLFTQLWDDSEEPEQLPVYVLEGVTLGLGYKAALRAWGGCPTCESALVPVYHISTLADLGNVLTNGRSAKARPCPECRPPVTPAYLTDTQVVSRLATLPEEIDAAERAVLAASISVQEAEDALESAKAALIPTLSAPNETGRKAQLFDATQGEREAVRVAQVTLQEQQIALRTLQNRFSAAKHLARLIAHDVD